MNKTFLGIAALLVQIIVGLSPIVIVKAALETKAGLGKLTGKLNSASSSVTGRARERAQSSNWYQNKEMTRQARQNEIKRGNIASFAELMSGDSARSRRARRRAAGGVVGQVLPNVNEAGQERIRLGGISQLEKQEHEEVAQATMLIEHQRVTSPGQLAEIAAGRTATGVDGRQVNGAGNHALQVAAMQKIIDAQDAEQLQNLFMDAGVDKDTLVSEIQKGKNYSTAKGAGAHFVQMQPRTYTLPEVQQQAVRSMSALSADKLATQDGAAWQAAERGFAAADPTTLAHRQAIWDQVQAIHADSRAENNVKGSARAAYEAILASARP